MASLEPFRSKLKRRSFKMHRINSSIRSSLFVKKLERVMSFHGSMWSRKTCATDIVKFSSRVHCWILSNDSRTMDFLFLTNAVRDIPMPCFKFTTGLLWKDKNEMLLESKKGNVFHRPSRSAIERFQTHHEGRPDLIQNVDRSLHVRSKHRQNVRIFNSVKNVN